MAEKQSTRLQEITESIESGIQELFQSERYLEYLKSTMTARVWEP